MPDDLSFQEEKVYYAVKAHLEQRGYAPSYQEIANAVGVASISSVSRFLRALREKGYVDWDENAKRTLRLLR